MRSSWELSVKAQYFAGDDNLDGPEQLLDLTKRMRKFIKDRPELEVSSFTTSFDSELGWNGTISWWGGVL